MQQIDLLKELSDIEDKLVVQSHRAIARKQAADEDCRTSSRVRQTVTATAAIATDAALKAEAPRLRKGIALCRKLRAIAEKGNLGSLDPRLEELRRLGNGVPPL